MIRKKILPIFLMPIVPYETFGQTINSTESKVSIKAKGMDLNVMRTLTFMKREKTF